MAERRLEQRLEVARLAEVAVLVLDRRVELRQVEQRHVEPELDAVLELFRERLELEARAPVVLGRLVEVGGEGAGERAAQPVLAFRFAFFGAGQEEDAGPDGGGEKNGDKYPVHGGDFRCTENRSRYPVTK